MTITDLRAHTERLSGVDPSLILGQVCWYEVQEATRIKHADFKNLLDSLGIERNVPNPPADHNVFRRVVTDAERTRIPSVAQDGVSLNILLRQMKNSGNTIQRRLVVETVDSAGNQLSYEQLVDVFFNKDTAAITTVTVNRTYDPQIEEIVRGVIRSIRSEFRLWQGALNGSAIRDWIRQFFLSEQAVSLRTGVYFLMQSRATNLEAIERLALNLGTVSVHHLPLLDDRRQRAMLQRAIEDETVGEVNRLMTEIAGLLGSDTKVREDTKTAYLTRCTELMRRTDEYAHLLEEGLASTQSRLNLFRQQAIHLMRK